MNTETITLQTGEVISRKDYCKLRAKDYAAAYPKAEITWNCIDNMIEICDTDRDLTEEEADRGHPWEELLELTCRELDESRKRASGEIPLSAPINTTVEPPAWSPNSEELEIIEAAKVSSLEGGQFSELRDIFDFGPGLKQLTLKEGATVAPKHYGALIGIGYRMAESGVFLVGEALLRLKAYGRFSNAIDQMSAELRLHGATLYGYAVVAERTPAEFRHLPYGVVSEITRARLDKDPEKASQKRLQLLQDADKNAWDSAEARSHVKMAQGREKSPERPKLPTYLVGLNGQYWLQDSQPPIEANMLLVNMRTGEILVDDGQKVSFQEIERR